ncbi:MAG: hypothetical protein VX435_04850 [Planctomycetota bacterium]|nr:hypothetical protein [Planctomycetota bacterium]
MFTRIFQPLITVLLLIGMTGYSSNAQEVISDKGNPSNLIVKELQAPQPIAERRIFDQAKRQGGILDSNAAQAIEKVIKWKIYRMTLTKERVRIGKHRRDILLDLHDASGQGRIRRFQTEVARNIAKYAPELFDNHSLVRLNAMALLATLPPDLIEIGIPAMVSELENDDQTEEVKLCACLGITNTAKQGFRNVTRKTQAISTVVTFLKKNHSATDWTKVRAIQALRALGRKRITRREIEPVIEVLVNIMRSGTESPMVRVEAAGAIATMDMSDLDLNCPLLAHELASLAARLGRLYVEKYDDIEGSTEINYWRLHFAKLVLSFRGTTTDPGSGLLNIARSKNQFDTVKSAEEVVIPVARMVVGEEFVDDVSDSVTTLEQWLSDNRPSDRHLTPDLAPLPENSDQVAIRNESN